MVRSVALLQRHAGERTQEVGYGLALDEFDFVASTAINAGPFPQTLLNSLRWASSQSADWIVTVDADVMVLPGSIRRGLHLAEQYPKHFFVIVSCVFDKFFGRIRAGGVRFYRRSLIAKALESSDWYLQIRPESALIQSMSERGFPSSSIALLAGVHDFEQYFRDLYRTALVQGVKFRHHAAQNLNRWNAQAADDADFRMMIRGFEDGLKLDAVALDAKLHRQAAAEAMAALQLTEKEPLSPNCLVDPARLIPARSNWLRAGSVFSRNFPEYCIKLANADRKTMLQTALYYRGLLRDRAPIRIV